jgi:fructoselysine-6-P-deglycase FrlB-like protein
MRIYDLADQLSRTHTSEHTGNGTDTDVIDAILFAADNGATVISLGEKEADVQFEPGISEPARGVLYLPVLQLMAFYRSLANGLNPDKPNHLTAVVQLDL